MSDLLQSGQHPDADQLSAFIDHALPEHEREETLAHLAICPHCRSIVALSMPAAEELPQAHPEPVRSPWFSRWIMVLPAGAALAALVLGSIYVRNNLVVEKHVAPMQTAQSTPPAPQEEPQPTAALKLQAPVRVTPRSGPVSATPAPETAPALNALDRLMPDPGGGGRTLHLNQNQMTAGAAKAEDRAAPPPVVAARHTLPSGLSALSTVANAGEVVAIDTQHTLFFSNDAGGHWNVITQPWQGRAVKVELIPASYPASTPSRTVVPAGLAVSTGVRDAVEGPKANLSGEITDPTGASIPNASVVLTNSVTQAVHRAKTDPAGHYTVDQLDPGNYTLQAEAPGFTPQQFSGLSLNAAQQAQKDLSLVVGAAAQTVEVQGAAQVALGAPKVREKISATRAAAPPVTRFEITTDAGEHWISTDGRSWQRKNE
jgi:hypothetical protein